MSSEIYWITVEIKKNLQRHCIVSTIKEKKFNESNINIFIVFPCVCCEKVRWKCGTLIENFVESQNSFGCEMRSHFIYFRIGFFQKCFITYC